MGLTVHQLRVLEAAESQDSQDSLTGKVSQFSDEQIAFVIGAYKNYDKERERVKIEAFMKHLRQQWKNQSWLTPPPSRKTVENMLVGNGCRKVKDRPPKRPGYHPAIKRFFPHVQTVLDGNTVERYLRFHSITHAVFTLLFQKRIKISAIIHLYILGLLIMHEHFCIVFSRKTIDEAIFMFVDSFY